MKKSIVLSLTIILLPLLIVFLFVPKTIHKFYINSSTLIRVKSEETGLITKVPLEEYVIGVLAGEMPTSFELEALKAQAVAARSYVMRRVLANQNKEYDVVDSVTNQVYVDKETLKNKWQNTFEERYQKLETAVSETIGEYLEYDGNIIDAMFFSTSTGATENSEEIFVSKVPYLRSVASTWDEAVSPVFSEDYTFSYPDFIKKLNVPNQKLNVQITETTSTGRIKKIKINGVTFTGTEVATLLGLRSNYFTITETNNEIKINTKGYGHGVGMSQYGALGMAKEGYTYDEILKYYYQGVEIKKLKI